MLDTFPYTTCDALLMDVPVITLAGKTCMARQSASLLAHLGLSEPIAGSPEDHVEIALRLAGEVKQLSELRSMLPERMKKATLTKPRRFTRRLEKGYR